MKIQIRTQGFELTPAIEAHVRDQISSNLANFRDDIHNIHFSLQDINGPKGGIDKKVLISIQLSSRLNATVERTRADLYAAVVVATRQAKRTIRRTLRKRRRMEKQALRHARRFPLT